MLQDTSETLIHHSGRRRRAIYIVIEGLEGVGKTTQAKKLCNHLTALGYKVLLTKEPGTTHLPLTMELRKVMLDNQFDSQLNRLGREYISQAIRSIHLEKLILPALDQYDFIIQDRGLLSGLAYGEACGNSMLDLCRLMSITTQTITEKASTLYDHTVLLRGDVEMGLSRAMASKREFINGDVIEEKGADFMKNVSRLMESYSIFFSPVHYIDAAPQDSIEQVFEKILSALQLQK